jgi:hypothetical protein
MTPTQTAERLLELPDKQLARVMYINADGLRQTDVIPTDLLRALATQFLELKRAAREIKDADEFFEMPEASLDAAFGRLRALLDKLDK